MKVHLAISALFLCFGFSRASQVVLSTENAHTHGVLRRYQARKGVTIQQVRALAQKLDLDIWHQTPDAIDIYSPPSTTLPHELSQIVVNTTFNLISTKPPVSTLVDVTEWDLHSLTNSTFHASYHPMHEVDRFMFDLADLHPNQTTVVQLGHSANGREMRALKISKGGRSKRPAIVITGAQHAREWIASATALYLAHALVANTTELYSLSHLLEHFEFHIIPVSNPDGYEYTWTTDRFWYKNRMSTSPRAKCIGLDMNRNWGYKWRPHARDQDPSVYINSDPSRQLKPKLPVDPCSHWFPGNRPFEAPETNNIANYVATIPNARSYLDLRSYGQMISGPYSYSCKRLPKDAEDQLEAAMGSVSAIRFTHGASFTAGHLCSNLYRAAGNVIDWMYARAGIKYSFAVHLRDTGTYGFALPAQWIRPVGEETGVMLEYLAMFMTRNK
jgi:murein tripeptide amidase MpaA